MESISVNINLNIYTQLCFYIAEKEFLFCFARQFWIVRHVVSRYNEQICNQQCQTFSVCCFFKMLLRHSVLVVSGNYETPFVRVVELSI